MSEQQEYRVLARKYRPTDFSGMVGQDALVQTLTNALASGRIAHAYMLTGIRGVGKTTTARIMARALNYGEKDAAPTADFKEITDQCRMIIEGRHVDVIEMDAASRTGVDDIREIIDGVQYAPATARYKVYIIDEVHMLSKSAFNALLKTLEEPPPHVKFIFATTEIRKVPVTVLSRCQRFDLKRIDQDVLKKYFLEIAEKEKVKVDDEAMALIAKAADGSARDGLSLLDQAIALGDGHIKVETVRDMLGLADRTRILDLFEYLLTGQAKDALAIAEDLYKSGADPVVVLQDLLDVTHFMTKAKSLPELAENSGLPEAERMKGEALASQLSIPVLTRVWQILMKGLNEVQNAPDPNSACEMVLIRLLYTSDMPDPGTLIKMIKNGKLSVGNVGVETSSTEQKAAPVATAQPVQKTVPQLKVVASNALVQEQEVIEPEVETQKEEDPPPQPQSFEEVVALFGQKGEIFIQANLQSFVRLVKFEPGNIEFRTLENAKPKLASEVAKHLIQWTGNHWNVTLSKDEGMSSLSEQAQTKYDNLMEATDNHEIMSNVRQLFPNAKLESIENLEKED